MIKSRKGFTLIELMIVMAIIGILAVVALVAISGKSVDARDARRLADASHIHLAFSLHAIEHGSDYLEGSGPAILLHQLGNKADIVEMMNLDGVKDPISSRTDTCYGGGAVLQCNRAGGYTIFDIYSDGGNQYLGTFDNYAIGMKLEQTESIARLDWRKFVGIKPAYAATCGDLVCEFMDGENNIANPNYCPGDCPCNNNFMCDAGESIDWCYCDCGGVIGCGGGPPPAEVCGNGSCEMWEFLNETCPADCGGGGGGGETDENDWLYIGPTGIMRASFNQVDLLNYTYSE